MAGEEKRSSASGDQGDVKKWEQLAADGDEESQVKLGEHFLTLADSSDEEKRLSYGKQAVHWLIEASKQGSEKADELLKKCLKTKTGVDDTNREEIDWCLETSSVEKKIRHAAKNMFKTLNSTHKEVMSSADYIEAVKKLTGGDKLEEKLLLAAGKKIGDQINETQFVKILSKKIQGQITLTSSESADQSVEYKHAGILQKVTKYPKETAMALYDTALETVSKEGLDFVTGLIPTNQIYMLSVFFLYGFITAALIFQVVPIVVFYLSLAIMCVTTLQMFYKKRKLREASKLANVLKNYDVGVDVDKTTSQYTWNSLTPYLIFFAGLPLLVVSFSLSNKMFIPCSELCILCGVLSALCFAALSDSHDLITLLLLVCNFLSALPTFFYHFPQIPVITTVLNVLTGALISIDCGAGFKIHIGIPSIAYLLVPLFFIFMAAQKSWRGVYQVLVPHLVCYFWFNLMLSFFPFSTWKGLIRAGLAYFFLPFLIPLAGLLCILSIFYAIYRLSQTQIFGKLAITLMLGAVPLLLSQSKILIGKNLDKKIKSVKIIVMVIFGVLALIPLIFIRLPSMKEPGKFEMPFEKYASFCGVENEVSNQIICRHLLGQKVVWSGVFQGAKVKKVENSVEPLLSGLPAFIANELRCVYGVKFGDCEDQDSDSDKELCQIMQNLGQECHLKNHDTYSFVASVLVDSADNKVSVSLEAGNSYREVLSALKEGDQVEFTATLGEGIGSASPSLSLRQIKCTSRQLDVMEKLEEESIDEIILRELNGALTVAFNFFWYPLVEYAP